MIRKLNKPAATSTEVFTACITSQIDEEIAARLMPLIPAIAVAETDYCARANAMELDELTKDFERGEASVKDLLKVYRDRMAKPDKAGRPFYDQLLKGDGRTQCPYCGIADIASLDHYLPKARYLAHVVNPDNLVPACTYCQDEKWKHEPTVPEEQVLHPYFDDFVFDRWLYARVVQIADGPVVLFYAENRNGLDDTLFERLQCHLTVFGLKERFKNYVSTRLSESALKFFRHGEVGNPAVLRAYLESELIDVSDSFIWMRPYLEALRDSDWFCSEGFTQI